MKETYIEMKDRHQKEVNTLPLMHAFSKAQFEEGCKKLGVTNPKSELFALKHIPGCYYRKTDSKLIWETFKRLSDETDAAMTDEEFAVSAFEYEAANHEFHINMDPHFDMANRFGYPTKTTDGWTEIDWGNVPNGEFLRKCYEKGTANFLEKAQY